MVYLHFLTNTLFYNEGSTKTAAKQRKIPIDKEAKKLEKAAQQQKKREEREQKKQEAMREKQLKRALNAANKNVKPNECIKVFLFKILVLMKQYLLYSFLVKFSL